MVGIVLLVLFFVVAGQQMQRLQDGRTLAVDAITGGLIQKWNEEHPDKVGAPTSKRNVSRITKAHEAAYTPLLFTVFASILKHT